MQDSDNKHWLDTLEVTGPIKGIMNFVDELSKNYDRRLDALHVEYQKDVEEILNCYKQEKEEYTRQLAEQKELISTLENELKALQQSYKTLSVEYKMNQDSLETTKQELSALTKALKQEEELLSVTKEQIQTANAQLRQELMARGVAPAPSAPPIAVIDDQAPVQTDAAAAAKPKRIRFRKTKAFFQQVIANRIKRPIILRPKKKPPFMPENFENSDSDSEFKL